MDAPNETQLLEVTSDARHVRNTLLPELAQSQSAQSAQSILDHPSPTRSLSKRKSLRARPNELLEQQHAVPPLPLRTRASQPELRSRPSKMSLFSLFSKPKVEKLRGYAEPGMDAPPRAPSHSFAPPSRNGSTRKEEVEQITKRPTTSKSGSGGVSRTIRTEPVPPLPPLPKIRVDPRAFEPLPLFQVRPQTIRQGTFEASTLTHEMVLQKNRQRLVGSALRHGSEGPHEDVPPSRGSGESRATVMTAFRSGSAASKGEDTSKKLFILVTSGYLVQYAETGASDRMPERYLKLSRNSAAFASDLIPGRHHVLQVSQAVDADGGVVNDRQSLFSKFSLRSYAPRRVASSFLIIMPGAQELGQWLTAIRQEIQQQGGKMARPDSHTEQRPRTGEPFMEDLHKTPSRSHRYQVKRDPSKVLSVISPMSPMSSWFQSPLDNSAEDTSERSAPAEQEHSKIECDPVQPRPRASSDSPSLTSSTGQSLEQQQLDKLRDSTRISHTSTAATTTTNPSRTNSMTSTPTTDQLRDAVDNDFKPPYRSLSSYPATKRRSAVPVVLKEVPTLSSPDGLLQQHRRLLATNPALEPPTMSPVLEFAPIHRLSSAQSVPNLHAKLDRRDSKVAAPFATSRTRPESFLGDLPDTTAWMNKNLPVHHRVSYAQQPPIGERPSSAQARTSGRNPPQSFSLPLRVNAIDVARRISTQTGGDTDVLSPIPAVHVLNAKVDAAERATNDAAQFPASSSSGDSCRASARLSLFPPAESASQQRPQSASANVALRRPTSLQVRNADQAAFLSSSRAYPATRAASQQRSTTTVPIRSLKPSRSLQTISCEAAARSEHRQGSVSSVVGEDGRATPLAFERRTPSPGPRSLSRTRTSILQIDYSIALGPPAPPPDAPLPELPPPGARSRSKSPMPRNIGVPLGDSRSPSALSIRES